MRPWGIRQGASHFDMDKDITIKHKIPGATMIGQAISLVLILCAGV
jgi:hypothetical protein